MIKQVEFVTNALVYFNAFFAVLHFDIFLLSILLIEPARIPVVPLHREFMFPQTRYCLPFSAIYRKATSREDDFKEVKGVMDRLNKIIGIFVKCSYAVAGMSLYVEFQKLSQVNFSCNSMCM